MEAIIRINKDNIDFPVDARELYTFLGNKKRFDHWIQLRIEQYDFIEGVDYQILVLLGPKIGRGRPSTEYKISMHMAMELSMVETSSQGKRARMYFIEVEKSWRRLTNPVDGLAKRIIGDRDFYNYMESLHKLGMTYNSQRLAGQVRHNPTEFVQDAEGWMVSGDYVRYIETGISRKLQRVAIKEREAKLLARVEQLELFN